MTLQGKQIDEKSYQFKVKSDKLNKPDDKKGKPTQPGKPTDDKKGKPTQPETTDKPSDDEDDELLISDNGPDKVKRGILSPDDPINEEYVNNLEVMSEPLYRPDNYIFVNEFEKEMDKIMNKLGKYDKEPEENKDDDKAEVTDNYLSHLNNLYNKVIPFIDDLHKDMEKTPDDIDIDEVCANIGHDKKNTDAPKHLCFVCRCK